MSVRRKVILYIATSLDGYIAKPDDDLTFLSIVESEGEDYGYKDFSRTVDTVIMGRKTYDWIMSQIPEFPHSDKTTYIITSRPQPGKGKLTFYSDGLINLVSRLKTEDGLDIFIDGGAEIVNELLMENLIDEFYISIIPVLLGEGKRLFKNGIPELRLILLETKQYDTGLVQLHYTNTDM